MYYIGLDVHKKTISYCALIAIGKPVGAPWSQDEKLAALSAWLALTPG